MDSIEEGSHISRVCGSLGGERGEADVMGGGAGHSRGPRI